MRVRTVLRLMLVVGGFVCTLFRPPAIFADEERPDWWKAQRQVTNMLLEPDRPIAELAGVWRAKAPRDSREAMCKVSLLMRAGMEEDVAQALQELKSLCPELDDHQVELIYYYACDKLEAMLAAKALVEIFADNISEIALYNRLLKHLLSSGWTVEQVDAWLAEMPSGRNNFWVTERLRFNMEHS